MDETLADIIIEPDDLLTKVIRYGEFGGKLFRKMFLYSNQFKDFTSARYSKSFASELWFSSKILRRRWIIQTPNQKFHLNLRQKDIIAPDEARKRRNDNKKLSSFLSLCGSHNLLLSLVKCFKPPTTLNLKVFSPIKDCFIFSETIFLWKLSLAIIIDLIFFIA